MLQKLNSSEKFDLQWLLILMFGAIYFSFVRNEFIFEMLWVLPALALLMVVKTPLMQIDIADKFKLSIKTAGILFYVIFLGCCIGYWLMLTLIPIGKGLDRNADLFQWYLTPWGQDWRYLLVVAHGISSYLLFKMRNKENPYSVLPAVAFLLVPAGIFISSRNWNDSLNLLLIIIAIWGLERSRFGLFYVALNLLLMASPYHWLFLPVFYARVGQRQSIVSFLAKAAIFPLITYGLVLGFSSDVFSGFVRSVLSYPGMIRQGIVMQFVRSYFFGGWFISLTSFKALIISLLIVLGFHWSRRTLWICLLILFFGLPYFNHLWLLFGSFLIFYRRGFDLPKSLREITYETTCFWFTRLFLVISLPLRYSDLIYYKKIGEYIWLGRVPFIDFNFEYPPLALVPMWVGKVFAAIFDSYDLGVYRLGYMAMLFILDLFFFGFLQRQSFKGLITKSALWVYILGGLVMGELIYDRLDLLLGMAFVLMMYWSWQQKYTQAFATAVVGAYFKLLTLITLPLTVIDLWKSEKPRKEKIELLVGAICGFTLCLGLCLVFFEDKFVYFLIYHRNRGLQVESLWSSILYFVTFLRLDFMPYFATISNYGALHVRNAPDFMVMIATLVPVILLLLVYWIHAVSSKVRNDEWREKRLFFLAVLVFTTFGKVLSPQYLIWTLCLYPFCHFDLSKKTDRWLTGMFALSLILTGAIFHFYFFVMILRPWMWGLILLRNLLLVAMTFIEFWQMWPSRDHRPEHTHPPIKRES